VFDLQYNNSVSAECFKLKQHLKNFGIGFTVGVKDKPLIINITGFNNTGKDTAARLIKEIIEENTELLVENISIADPIRKMAAVATNDNIDAYTQHHLKESTSHPFQSFTRRELMIEITEKMFEIDKDFWWKIAHRKIEYSDANIITVSDVRYSEWLDYLKNNNYNFRLLEICKSGTASQYSAINPLSYGVNNFRSIYNNTTIEDLKNNIKHALIEWGII